MTPWPAASGAPRTKGAKLKPNSLTKLLRRSTKTSRFRPFSPVLGCFRHRFTWFHVVFTLFFKGDLLTLRSHQVQLALHLLPSSAESQRRFFGPENPRRGRLGPRKPQLFHVFSTSFDGKTCKFNGISMNFDDFSSNFGEERLAFGKKRGLSSSARSSACLTAACAGDRFNQGPGAS